MIVVSFGWFVICLVLSNDLYATYPRIDLFHLAGICTLILLLLNWVAHCCPIETEVVKTCLNPLVSDSRRGVRQRGKSIVISCPTYMSWISSYIINWWDMISFGFVFHFCWVSEFLFSLWIGSKRSYN